MPGLILIPGAAALGMATTLYSALAGRERPEYALWIAVMTTPVAIALYFVLIPWLEAEGAALGSDVAYISSAVMAGIALRRVSGPGEGIRAVLPGRAELDDYKVLARQVRHRFSRGLFAPAGPVEADPVAEAAPEGVLATAGALDVAVVIPHYNHGRYIADAVESALAQDVGRPRIVVVDDGSTDPAAEAALAALPAEVEVIRQANAGQAAARNAGARATSEPLLLFLDADDRLPPDAIGSLRQALAGEPGAAYAYGRMRYFGAWSGVVEFPPFDPYRLLYRSIVGWLGLIRREAFEQVAGFDEQQAGFEDWDLMLAFLERGWGADGDRLRGARVPQARRDLGAGGPPQQLPAALPRAAPAPLRALPPRPAAGREKRPPRTGQARLPPLVGLAAAACATGARPLRAPLQGLNRACPAGRGPRLTSRGSDVRNLRRDQPQRRADPRPRAQARGDERADRPPRPRRRGDLGPRARPRRPRP